MQQSGIADGDDNGRAPVQRFGLPCSAKCSFWALMLHELSVRWHVIKTQNWCDLGHAACRRAPCPCPLASCVQKRGSTATPNPPQRNGPGNANITAKRSKLRAEVYGQSATSPISRPRGTSIAAEGNALGKLNSASPAAGRRRVHTPRRGRADPPPLAWASADRGPSQCRARWHSAYCPTRCVSTTFASLSFVRMPAPPKSGRRFFLAESVLCQARETSASGSFKLCSTRLKKSSVTAASALATKLS